MGIKKFHIAFLVAALTAAWTHGSPAPVGTLALNVQPLVASIGVNLHISQGGAYSSASNITTNLAYLGVKNVRDLVVYSGEPNESIYYTVAATGVKFNMYISGMACNDGFVPASGYISFVTSQYDLLVAATPGSIRSAEGANEINNQPVCYLNTNTTSSATTSGATLHFSATPGAVQAVAAGGYGSGMVVTDTTTGSVIPSSTTVLSATATTVVLSASVTGAGVGSGDTIQFEANQTNPASGIAWQQELYNGVHGDTSLAGVVVPNFTDFPSYGVTGSADNNNGHIYPTFGSQPGNTVSGWQYLIEYGQQQVISGIPQYVTETGWFTTSNGTDGVDQNTQARYTLNGIMDLYTAFSVPQIYLYELFDEGTDTNPQNNYGLYTNGNSAKVSATAIHNFTTILADSGAVTPTRLNYSITGLSAPSGSWPTGNAGGYSALFQKSNGHFEIIIWNEPEIWNESTQLPITPSTSSLTINLGGVKTTVNVYDPITGSSAINTYSSVSSITASIGADPLIVEVIP